MDRLKKVQYMYLDYIDSHDVLKERDSSIEWEKVHMASCARVGYILAAKRGLDPDFAAIAAAIHDIGRVVNGRQKGHAEAGYEQAKEFLAGTGLFSESETEELAYSVKMHSSKAEIGSPLEELVKDADVLDFHMYGYEMPRKEQQDRLQRLLEDHELF